MRKLFQQHPESLRKTSGLNKTQFGFSLIEIVVTVLIVGIGMLGVMAMQANTVRESQNNYFRSQASILAQDIVGRMRANQEAVAETAASVYVTDGTDVEMPDPGCSSAASDCDSATLATFDLAMWQRNIDASNLPSAIGVISRDGTTTTYVISLLWDEERSGVTGRGCDPSDSNDMACFRITAVL